MCLSKPPRIKSPQRKKKRNDCEVNWEQSAAGATNQTQLWQQPSLSWVQNILCPHFSFSFTLFIDSTKVQPITKLARHLLSNITRENFCRLLRNKQSNNLKAIICFIAIKKNKQCSCMRHLCPVREPQKPEGNIYSQALRLCKHKSPKVTWQRPMNHNSH